MDSLQLECGVQYTIWLKYRWQFLLNLLGSEAYMEFHLKIVLLIFALLIFVGLIVQVKQKKLDLQYTMSWIVMVFGLVVVILFPGLLSTLTMIMGVSTPVNMIFFLGFCFALLIIYNLTKYVSKLSCEIKSLSQSFAILEKKMKDNYHE